MLPEDLKQKLMEVDSSREKRYEIAFWITKKPHYLRETLVSCQAPAMQCLYFLGWDDDKKWIYPELRNILTKNAPNQSAGYQARAGKILKTLL